MMPPTVEHLCGGMPLAVLGAAIDALGWPDTRLVRDFVFGFRSVGRIPDSGVFAPGGKPMAADPDRVLAGNARYASRLVDQTEKRGRREPGEAAEVYAKTISERDSGLCLGPFSRAQLDRAWGYNRWRPMPRFGIWQKGKLRVVDDGRSSEHNDVTATAESLRCCRADFPLRVARAFAARLGPRVPRLAVGTDDIASAYRLIPAAQLHYHAVAVWSGERVEFFVVPGHPFGLTSAVLNFNRVPKFAVFFAQVILAVCCDHFYDDAATVEPEHCAEHAQRCLGHVMSHVVGLPFSEEKHVPARPSNAFLGVVSDLSHVATAGVVSLRVTEDRRSRLLLSIAEAIVDAQLSPAAAATLEGRVMFVITSQFGRVGKAALTVVRHRALGRDDSTAVGGVWPHEGAGGGG